MVMVLGRVARLYRAPWRQRRPADKRPLPASRSGRADARALLGLGVVLAAAAVVWVFCGGGAAGAEPVVFGRDADVVAAPIDAAPGAPPGTAATAMATASTTEATAREFVPALPPTSAEVRLQHPTGRIRGRVVDALGRPAAGVPLRALCMQDLAIETRTTAATTGAFAFDGVRIGDYRVCVDHERLEPRWRTIEASSKRTKLLADADVDLGDLVVECPASLRGCVVTKAQVGIAGARVELVAWPKSKARPTRTDALGQFAFTDVLPGKYHLRIALDDCEPAHRGLSIPRQRVFALASDAVRMLEPIVCGVGTARVRGRVVDADGRPVPDLVVQATAIELAPPEAPVGQGNPVGRMAGPRPQQATDDEQPQTPLQKARTDADGRFVLPGLGPGSTRIDVGVNAFSRDARYGENRLATAGPTASVELAEGQDADLGTSAVVLSRPWRLDGQVVLDPAWSAAGTRPDELDAWVTELRTPQSLPDVFAERRQNGMPLDRNTHVAIDKSWSFTWWCETPRGELRLHIRSKRNPAVTAEYPFTAVPMQTTTTTLRFPP